MIKKRSSKKSSIESKNKKKESRFSKWVDDFENRRANFLSRRPHRSFRRTKRRDYRRSLEMPGYFGLAKEAGGIIWANKRVLLTVAVLYVVLMVLTASFVSQEAYVALQDVIKEAQGEGSLGSITSTAALMWGVISTHMAGAHYGTSGSSQQILGAVFGLLMWLTVVWLLRTIMAGGKPKARDGIYSSGSPIIALIVLTIVAFVQALPAIASIVAYGAASSSGLFNQTAMLMAFGGAAILLITLSVYWLTSTVMAMIIITLPGMYPFRALKLAGDLCVGRRIRILLRLLWAGLLITVAWIVALGLIVLLDGALKSAIPAIGWLPLVPIAVLVMVSLSIVMIASYVYVFYRRVVEDDSPPA